MLSPDKYSYPALKIQNVEWITGPTQFMNIGSSCGTSLVLGSVGSVITGTPWPMVVAGIDCLPALEAARNSGTADPRIAGIFKRLGPSSSWYYEGPPIKISKIFHTEGMVKIGDDFVISSVQIGIPPVTEPTA